IWGLLAFILIRGVGVMASEVPPLTLVMCHPTTGQIQNILQLRSMGLLPAEPFRLIGVYHQDEKTDYAPAREFVRKEGFDWIEFVVIRGALSTKDIAAGTNPWTPEFSRLYKRAHGMLFTGGSDLLPGAYGQSHLLLTDADNPARNHFELSFLSHLLGDPRRRDSDAWLKTENGFPLLAVCLGAQTLNVALGGTLWQDIPWQVYGLRTAEDVLALGPDQIHSSRYMAMLNPGMEDLLPAFHFIRWRDEADWLKRLPAALNPVVVLSSHHQAIRALAKDLVVVARSLDGRVVEAVAHRRYPNVLGVQFHPEFAALFQKERLYRPAPGGEPTLSLVEVLNRRPGSRQFHEQLWHWFSDAMKETRSNRQKNEKNPLILSTLPAD
ncbi:MAG: gamma-glutamyl-gamma-aminobutyrate hydrolase family protein, partial [Candidatus Aminicenantes bacterium]|nr:gamma-glutamyl-gamma-aminobutyrate hydrolase family protein [Candidatus Aminicenantes bacterium]